MSKDASGQVDPKKTNGEKRVKRGRLHFTEEEVTRQAGEQASGQVGPKSIYQLNEIVCAVQIIIIENVSVLVGGVHLIHRIFFLGL